MRIRIPHPRRVASSIGDIVSPRSSHVRALGAAREAWDGLRSSVPYAPQNSVVDAIVVPTRVLSAAGPFVRLTKAVAFVALVLALIDGACVVSRADELEARIHGRIGGNDPLTEGVVARALLATTPPVQILRVRVEREGTRRYCGVVLSGVKFHRPIDRAGFLDEVRGIVTRAYAAAPELAEVDVWATEPLSVGRGVPVSGDLAHPTSAIVFSITVPREEATTFAQRLRTGRDVFWDRRFAFDLDHGVPVPSPEPTP